MKLYALLLFVAPTLAFSQVNTPTWGVEDTILVISKTTDFGAVHDYIELYNNSGQDLDMRWVCTEPTSWPSLWITNFTDPTANYDDVQNLDSADFLIPDPIEWSNKLIIGVQHNSYAHTDTLVFDVWPLSAPQDKLRLYYVIIIAQGNAWASVEEEQVVDYHYSSLSKQLTFSSDDAVNEVNIYNLSGQLVLQESALNASSMSLEGLKEQCVLINVKTISGTTSSFKLLLR